MATCGGILTTQRITVGVDAQQLYGQLEARRRVIVRADPANTTHVWLTSSQSASWREGFLLYPGESLEITGPGAKAVLWGLTYGGTATVLIMSEGEAA